MTTDREPPAGSDVHLFHAPAKDRTRETVAVLVTIAVLFLLLFVLVGHRVPSPSLPHPHRMPAQAIATPH